jgi:hypothetical protein
VPQGSVAEGEGEGFLAVFTLSPRRDIFLTVYLVTW